MLTSPSERERHHSASSERCPTNAKAVIMTIQHRCRRALIWCQSNLQANYVGFIIIIIFFFSISAPLDLLLTFPCCQSPWNHLFEEIENHRCTPHPHPRVFSAVFGIYIHIYFFYCSNSELIPLNLYQKSHPKGQSKGVWLKGLSRWF